MRALAFLALAATFGAAQEKQEPAVYVLLLKEGRRPTAARLTDAATKAFGVEFINGMVDPAGAKKLKRFVVEPTPGRAFLVSSPTTLFVVQAVRQPLWEKPAVAAAAYPNAKDAILAHRAVLTVKAMHAKRAKNRRERDFAYTDLGKLTKALWGDDVLALYVPEANLVLPAKKATPHLLAKDALGSMRQGAAGVVPVVSDDPAVQKSIELARRNFERFARVFHDPGRAHAFKIQVAVMEAGTIEHLWIDVRKIDRGRIEGVLDTKPLHLVTCKRGDPIVVTPEQIGDWIYTLNGRMIGGYTVKRK